jgi:phosphatidylserine/phosphatidylglycerophosphate/cardiolipin synthase-like enzyme
MEFAAAVDRVIQQNLGKLQKPGVMFFRPGYKSKGGRLTTNPAIVVTVDNKRKDIPAQDRVPSRIGRYATDVRQASPMHRLRASNPDLYAEVAAGAPPEIQRPIFPFERDATGQLVGPAIEQAFSKVSTRKAPKPQLNYAPPAGYSLDPITDQFTITCHASPDAGWPTLQPFIAGTKQQISMAMYEFTAPYIVQSLVGAVQGKKLSLVLDDPNDPTKRDQTEDVTRQELVKGVGSGLTFAWALEAFDPHVAAWIYPSAYHIKVIVRDGKALWLSSGNLNRTNQPDIDPLQNSAAAKAVVPGCDRDWHVIVEHAKLAGIFKAYIEHDLAVASKNQGAEGSSSAVARALNTQAKPTSKGKGKVPKVYFAPKSITAKMTVQPVLTPDNYANSLLPLIRSAKKSFVMQTQYINPPKATPTPGSASAQADEVLEALIAAVAELIREGVNVRLIMSEFETQDKIELLQQRGISQKYIQIQQNVHNKSIIIDSAVVVVGSQNWSGQGVSTNRDASLIIHNAEAALYWEKIFDHDWTNMVMTGGLD